VDPETVQWVAVLAAGGFIGGLALLVRGMGDYRTAARIADTSTSKIGSIAAGEVRISGVIEPAELILVSLLQSASCVYYRSTIGDDDDDGLPGSAGDDEERAVGFRVRDATGSLRVFPRGARIDAPVRFEGSTGTLGDEPPGLSMRIGEGLRLGEPDREAAIAELLRVRAPEDSALRRSLAERRGARHYREARLEPGDAVTIVGRALPFGDLPDPAGADIGSGAEAVGATDPEVAADLAEARAAGTLVADPEQAWGNAAIPGFGIGRPSRQPEIDPTANPLPLAGPDAAARAERTFEIDPETLVVAASDEVPLLIAHGLPGAASERNRDRFLLGLAGAVVSVVSAMVFAITVGGGFGP
jgi:hypothetical protein